MGAFSSDELRELGEIGYRAREVVRAKSKAAAKDLWRQISDEQHSLLVDWIVYRLSGKRPASKRCYGPKAHAQVCR